MLLYVNRNRKAHYSGNPRTTTSTFTQFLSSDLVPGAIRPDIAVVVDWSYNTKLLTYCGTFIWLLKFLFNAELSPKRYWPGPRSQGEGEEGDYV